MQGGGLPFCLKVLNTWTICCHDLYLRKMSYFFYSKLTFILRWPLLSSLQLQPNLKSSWEYHKPQGDACYPKTAFVYRSNLLSRPLVWNREDGLVYMVQHFRALRNLEATIWLVQWIILRVLGFLTTSISTSSPTTFSHFQFRLKPTKQLQRLSFISISVLACGAKIWGVFIHWTGLLDWPFCTKMPLGSKRLYRFFTG